jgi:hypothetical protein
VTVNPGGTVTRTEVTAPANRGTAPDVSAHVSAYGNTSTSGFRPRQGPGIGEKQTFGIGEKQTFGIGEKQTWGIGEKQTFGIAQPPAWQANGFYSNEQHYTGVYPPVNTVPQVPFGYPQYYPQYYYPQGYYPAPGYYGYQPDPYTIPLGHDDRPSAWVTHIGSSAPIYFPPAPVYCPPVQPVCPPVNVCSICHHSPCAHSARPGVVYGSVYNGAPYNGMPYNGTVYSSTTVSPSAGITFGSRGVGVRINTGRTTTSTTTTSSYGR